MKSRHAAVARAIQKGEMERQPCEVCGKSQNVVAHHDDHDKPLDVRWLCRRHHAAYHKAAGSYRNNGLNRGRRPRIRRGELKGVI